MSGIGCCLPHAANHCREQVMVESSSAIPYRVFIALPIPGPVKDEIVRVQDELRNLLPRRCVRFTKREQFHLTLRFLGNVKSQRVEGLINEIRAACREFSVLKLRAERGCFWEWFLGFRVPNVGAWFRGAMAGGEKGRPGKGLDGPGPSWEGCERAFPPSPSSTQSKLRSQQGKNPLTA